MQPILVLYPVFNAPEPESLMSISATHVTLSESDASELITWPHFKLLNAHFSVHYLDNTHQSVH